ncbi:MAG: peptidoglycan DD-metalloendopeptidase family protein [Pseudomonadota bacterium]|nr:peptidoglycan DD-metalloendopeptidase family protein [Pseudomonadota bacterium]
MIRRAYLTTAACSAAVAGLLIAVPQSFAQREVVVMEPEEAREQLDRATVASQKAEARAARFATEAEEATQAADKTAREAAKLAAQIQGTEARITAARARFSLAQIERARLTKRLADRREPLVRLTAALQTSSRRPLALSALQPGSMKDIVYVRAVLDSAIPQIQARTATLREELEQGRKLERQARRALGSLRQSEQDLQDKRAELAKVETRQRLASTNARGNAVREEERALALAEEARDLDGLIDRLDANAKLRRELAALSGPVLRPANLASATPVASTGEGQVQPRPSPTATATAAAALEFQLPVQGRTITGFGQERSSGLRSKGLELAPEPGALIVAPASGRVAFSGPYEGFGRIVIIEHSDGWTSLVTGLERLDADVGEQVIAGAPIGVAAREEPVIGIELRRGGTPVNPLDFL